MNWIPIAVIGGMMLMAAILIGVIIAALRCSDRMGPDGLEFNEWKDGRIAPYSHENDI